MTYADDRQKRVILFDGVCNLCNTSVNFVLQHEREPIFQFASIQSEVGKALLADLGLSSDYTKAVILIDHGKTYFGSTAALKIGQSLKFPWSMWATMGILVPLLLRDWIYGQIASHRYQWFGKRDICMVPSESLKKRFL